MSRRISLLGSWLGPARFGGSAPLLLTLLAAALVAGGLGLLALEASGGGSGDARQWAQQDSNL